MGDPPTVARCRRHGASTRGAGRARLPHGVHRRWRPRGAEALRRRPRPGTARRVWRELQREIQLILDAELVHGDLSAFNVLWWHERPVIIDFSQSVDVVVHPAARDLLRRDVERTAGYFRRQGVAVDLDAALALVGDSPARFAHQVLSS